MLSILGRRLRVADGRLPEWTTRAAAVCHLPQRGLHPAGLAGHHLCGPGEPGILQGGHINYVNFKIFYFLAGDQQPGDAQLRGRDPPHGLEHLLILSWPAGCPHSVTSDAALLEQFAHLCRRFDGPEGAETGKSELTLLYA